MFQFIPQNEKQEERSRSYSGDERVVGEAAPFYEDALDTSHDLEAGTIQQNQADRAQCQDVEAEEIQRDQSDQAQRQDIEAEAIQQNQSDQPQHQDVNARDIQRMNSVTDQQHKVERLRRRHKLQELGPSPSARLCLEIPLAITYFVGYLKDNAASNVWNHDAASKCTYFPQLFCAWFVLYAANCLSVFAVIKIYLTQEGEVDELNWFYKPSYQTSKARCLSMCAYWIVYLGKIVLEFIIVIHFLDIDENCQGLIKSVGSNLFWICIQIISYYSLVLLGILVLFCIGWCAADAAEKRCTRSNGSHRKAHPSVQMTSNNNNKSTATGGVYKFSGNQSEQDDPEEQIEEMPPQPAKFVSDFSPEDNFEGVEESDFAFNAANLPQLLEIMVGCGLDPEFSRQLLISCNYDLKAAMNAAFNIGGPQMQEEPEPVPAEPAQPVQPEIVLAANDPAQPDQIEEVAEKVRESVEMADVPANPIVPSIFESTEEDDSSESDSFSQESKGMEDREELPQHMFTAKGCGMAEFHGKYFVDTAYENGFWNGKRCYRKNGVGDARSKCMIWYNSFLKWWVMSKNDCFMPYYFVKSDADQPPTSGWDVTPAGSGAPPQLVYGRSDEEGKRMQDREEPFQHIFTVRGCGMCQFNGKYFVDTAQENGFVNGKRCYRKDGVGNVGDDCTINYYGGFWVMRKDYRVEFWYYGVKSDADEPPTSGWVVTHGSGSPPQLVYGGSDETLLEPGASSKAEAPGDPKKIVVTDSNQDEEHNIGKIKKPKKAIDTSSWSISQIAPPAKSSSAPTNLSSGNVRWQFTSDNGHWDDCDAKFARVAEDALRSKKKTVKVSRNGYSYTVSLDASNYYQINDETGQFRHLQRLSSQTDQSYASPMKNRPGLDILVSRVKQKGRGKWAKPVPMENNEPLDVIDDNDQEHPQSTRAENHISLEWLKDEDWKDIDADILEEVKDAYIKKQSGHMTDVYNFDFINMVVWIRKTSEQVPLRVQHAPAKFKIQGTIEPLPKGSDEYNQVLLKFQTSFCKRCEILCVSKVRCQVKDYAYSIQEDIYEQTCVNGANERQVWHGTKKENIDKIVNQGFNRALGYVMAYGDGTYFASQSTGSFHYATEDSVGTRHMFLCDLLVGDFCIGRSEMKVPDPKDGMQNIPHETMVNNIQNPSVFVSTKDDQARPRYLVTFRDYDSTKDVESKI